MQAAKPQDSAKGSVRCKASNVACPAMHSMQDADSQRSLITLNKESTAQTSSTLHVVDEVFTLLTRLTKHSAEQSGLESLTFEKQRLAKSPASRAD